VSGHVHALITFPPDGKENTVFIGYKVGILQMCCKNKIVGFLEAAVIINYISVIY
jgi:hypothetical protein